MKSDLGVYLPGGKTGILLLHDVGGSAAELRALAGAFARSGYTVACPQLTAIGGAQETTEVASAGKLVAEAEQALGKLKTRCDSVVVAGVAYGAMLALQIARNNIGTVQAVVLHEPRAWLPSLPFIMPAALAGHLSQGLLARALALVDGLRRPHAHAMSPVGPLGFARVGATPPGHALEQLGALLDSVHAGLPAIQQPVLLVHRQTTARTGLDGSLHLQRRLGGRVESVMVDDAFDLQATPTSDRAAEGLADRSIRFIAAVFADLKTQRENEQRRQKIAAGRSNAA